MIDDKKIEKAAREAADLYEQDLPLMSYDEDTEVDGQHHFCQAFGAELFKDGVKWAINEFLKDLLHPASEVPRNNNRKVLAFSDSETKLYNMNELMDKTNCTTYNEMWEQEVKKYHLKCWLFVKDFIESIMKGGNND